MLVHILLSSAEVQEYISVITTAENVPAGAQQKVLIDNFLNLLSLDDSKNLHVSSNSFTLEIISITLPSIIRKNIRQLFKMVMVYLLSETVQPHAQK